MAYKLDDYTGKRMALANGAIERCDSCTDKITGDYIRVADAPQTDFIYCLECGTELKGGE
tara:strand:- start:1254 stop:1433 length:180 start_codon:yes stop_codon:yes gene_type:complete